MTPQAADPCGRDVVAVYDLKRRNEANANYDLVGRYYYLWPNNATCREEVHDRLSGVARITQEVRPNGLLCEVQLQLEFDVTEDEKYGPNRFSKLITLVGADTSRFAATATGETGATVFYEAPAHTVDRAAGPADEDSDVVTDRSDATIARPRQAYAPNRRQFFDRRVGRFYFYDPRARGLFLGRRRPSRVGLYSATTKMKPSKRASVSCQRTASRLWLGIQRLEAISSNSGSGWSRRSTSSTSRSPRDCACLSIHCAGASAKRVGRVEPMITAIRGLAVMITSGMLVSTGNQITKVVRGRVRRHFAVTR
jgi:hypothetical protein